MVNLFRNKSYSGIVFLALLFLVVHAHFFVEAPVITTPAHSGFFEVLIQQYIQPLPGYLLFLVYAVLVLLQAIRFNLALNNAHMFQQSGYTTGMAYILLTGFLPGWSHINAALLANTFIIWIFVKLIRLYNNPAPKTLLFNIGLISGGTILSYHPSITLVLVIFFALAVVRPFRSAEWLVLLIGVIFPYYIVAAFLFITNQTNNISGILPHLQLAWPLAIPAYWLGITISYVLLLFIPSFYFWQLHVNRMVIQIRKNWMIVLVLLLVSLFGPFIFSYAGRTAAFVWIIPLSAFFANYFLYPKKTGLPNLFFWLALLLIFHNNWLLGKI
ncbi:hypothetical protein [Hydrotalea sp.]|uniref:hypothetical protein n=1 Tax=Hydrotalea sp. TaxID=2881279 RepID=UPI002627ED3A|nr:hypothetical protein [Hydrotalea sp.]